MDRSARRFRRALQAAGLACVLFWAPAGRSQPATDSLDPAIRLALGTGRTTAQYNYVMTGKVRLILLWLSSDDVGGGYVRRGVSQADPSTQFIQVLFGSDPAKAPRHINHWGSAIETTGNYSTLFGFMKAAKTASPRAAEAEIARQSEKGEHAFEAIVSLVDNGRALSRVIPLRSSVDFNLHQLAQAQQVVAERLTRDGHIRHISPDKRKCAAARGFLQAVDELARQSIRSAARGQSLCYIHNAREYTLTPDQRSAVQSEDIEFKLKTGDRVKQVYKDLVSSQFSVLNHESGKRTEFELLLGTSGRLMGVPVRIIHQPNFWFKVVLNLDTVQ
jgi:hypothetical protein